LHARIACIGDGQSQIDALRARDRCEIADHLARDGREVDTRGRRVGDAGLFAREGEHLLDQPRRALESAL
jgi:hypothetical protein